MMQLPPLGYNWPFPSVNGARTPESIVLIEAKPEKPPTQYEICQKSYFDQQTEPEEALL